MSQFDMFGILAAPPKPAPKEPTPELSAEEIFFRRLYGRPTERIYLCSYCQAPYHCISYHLLRECSADWDGRKQEAPEATSPLPQEETPVIERSENMPGAYAYKSKGVDKAEVMHPNYRPPQKETATAATTQPTKPAPPNETHIELHEAGLSNEKPSEGSTLKVELAPHFWHWATKENGSWVRYTPDLETRRRSIPAIACSLYYAVEASVLSMKVLSASVPAYYAANKLFYDTDKKKVERFISLLIFCGLDEDRVRWWVREAWTAARQGPLHPWPETKKQKGAGAGLLGLLGYQLAEGEADGFGDINPNKKQKEPK